MDKKERYEFKKKGIVYSILVMFMLGTLFLFLISYVSSNEKQSNYFISFTNAQNINMVVSDLRSDILYISNLRINQSANSVLLSNVSDIDYSSYVTFINNVYSKKLNVFLNFTLDDSYFSKEYIIYPDNVTVLNSSLLLLNIYINETNYNLSFNGFSSGTFPITINFYNYSDNSQFTVNQNINISKNQNIILSDGSSIVINNMTLFLNTMYAHHLDIYLNSSNPIYFGSLLNLTVGDYDFYGPIRFW